MNTYSSTLTWAWAQTQAADAIRQWNQAQAATDQAKAQHAQAPPNTPFNDPGEAGRQAAQDILNRARRQLDSVGDTAADAVDKARDKAPPKPGFWSRLGSDIEDIAGKVGHTLENAGKEFVNAAASLGNAASHHPDQLGTEIAGIGLTAASAAGLGGSGLLDATVVASPAGVALGGYPRWGWQAVSG